MIRTYLFSPFTAFIVLFGTVVTLRSEADLHLMDVSVTTLKSASKYSPGIAKLHTACETFFNLAKSYMAQKVTEGETNSGLLYEEPERFDVASLSKEDWDEMFKEWELGLSGKNAREVSSFLATGFFPA